MNFHQSFEKCSILNPYIRKQPQTFESIKGELRFNNLWPLEGATCMFITLYGNIFGGIPKMLVLCNFLKVQWNLIIKRSDISKPSYNKVILLVPALYISLFFTLI